MESRSTWTDERLDDRFDHIDGELRGLRTDVRELRVEMRSEIGGLRDEMRSEIGGLRDEMRSEIGGLRDQMRSEIGGVRGEVGTLRGEIDALRLAMIRVGGAGFLGLIAAVLVRGG
jgi:hypothetical protein